MCISREHSAFTCYMIAGLFAATAAAGPVASSTFDTDYENWTAGFGADRSVFATYQPTGGNPGGNLLASDRDDSAGLFVWHFEAGFGTPFYGNMSAASGGTLEFDLNTVSTEPPERGLESNPYDIWLQSPFNAGTTLFLSGLSAPATGAWTHYSIPLVAGQWRSGSVNGAVATQTHIDGVLSNLTNLRIRGNWNTLDDTTRLDNVVLTPEPASLAAWLALGAWMLVRRRAV